MPLLAFNLTAAPVVLTVAVPPTTLPISANPPERGPAVNVTTELRPSVAVDAGHGVAGGLSGANYVTLQAQVTAGSVAYEWTETPEYATTGLTVPGGAVPGPHAATHIPGAGDALATGSTGSTFCIGNDGRLSDARAPLAHAATHKTAGSPADMLTVAAASTSYVEEHTLEAPGTNYHAAYAGGAAINDAIGPWTMPFPRRTVQIDAAGVTAVSVTVTGTAPDGSIVTDIIACAGIAIYQGVKAFEAITSVTSDVDPVTNITLQTGNGFGTVAPFAALQVLSADGVVEAAASNNPASGTVVPTSVPNGATIFSVRYTRSHAHNIT